MGWSNLDSISLSAESFAEALRQEEARSKAPLQPRRYQIPTMNAESWRTMDESLFRTLVTGAFQTIVSPEAYDAIKERAKVLGIKEI